VNTASPAQSSLAQSHHHPQTQELDLADSIEEAQNSIVSGVELTNESLASEESEESSDSVYSDEIDPDDQV
jgi:hypothetical protein